MPEVRYIVLFLAQHPTPGAHAPEYLHNVEPLACQGLPPVSAAHLTLL
jgi:hypothetical protein